MARRTENKSEKIRQWFTKHPNGKSSECATALNVHPSLVSNVKGKMTGTGGTQTANKVKPGPKPGPRKARSGGSAASGNFSAAKDFVASCGGFDEARASLDELQDAQVG